MNEEVIANFRKYRPPQFTPVFFVIIDCGHWLRVETNDPPRPGSQLNCPSCNLPKVTHDAPTPEKA